MLYEILLECDEPGDGNWDAPAFLYAIGDQPEIWEELGQGGAAAIAANGGLKWVAPSQRPGDLYVHVFDQEALNARIDELLALDAGGRAASPLPAQERTHASRAQEERGWQRNPARDVTKVPGGRVALEHIIASSPELQEAT